MWGVVVGTYVLLLTAEMELSMEALKIQGLSPSSVPGRLCVFVFVFSSGGMLKKNLFTQGRQASDRTREGFHPCPGWRSCEFIRVTYRAWGTHHWEVPWMTHRQLRLYLFPTQCIGCYIAAIGILGSLKTTRGSQEGLLGFVTLFPPSTRGR